MLLPECVLVRLEDFVRSQRRKRDALAEARVRTYELKLRAWAADARDAHDNGDCVPNCPFKHERST